MFSGIIETTGTILQIDFVKSCKQFSISPMKAFNDLTIGDSIAVNGVCLTVTEFDATIFKVTAVPETLFLTNLDDLMVNHSVNLERSLKFGDRIGGHHVQGHIDGAGEILELVSDNSNAYLVKLRIPEKLAKYVIAKGYIALDGMSMTVIKILPSGLTITLIPHTKKVTIANQYQIGTKINIEVDRMGKYIENFIQKTITIGVH